MEARVAVIVMTVGDWRLLLGLPSAVLGIDVDPIKAAVHPAPFFLPSCTSSLSHHILNNKCFIDSF